MSSREIKVSVPIDEGGVRKLQMGDVVYLSGVVHTLRDMAYERAVGLLGRGEELPFDLENGAIWHCGPIMRRSNDKWETVAAGPTSSSRFTELEAELVRRLHTRLAIGKGTMGEATADAFKDVGGAYLVATGGCAALYAMRVKSVENVYWLDLGMPEAVWVFRVEGLGPLVVGIDSNGKSLSDNVTKTVNENLKKIFQKYRVDPNRNYVWWPKRVVGTPISL